MGKSKARVTRVNRKRSDVTPPAPAGPPSIAELASTWKATHIAEVRAKAANERAREAVKARLGEMPEHLAVTGVGTIALTPRAGSTSIDWEAIARAHVDPATLERVLPEHTTMGSPSLVLAAPKEWGLEAKSRGLAATDAA
jgi:hypothetical protein